MLCLFTHQLKPTARLATTAKLMASFGVSDVLHPESTCATLEEGPHQRRNTSGVLGQGPLTTRERGFDDRTAARVNGRSVGLHNRPDAFSTRDRHNDASAGWRVKRAIDLDGQGAKRAVRNAKSDDVFADIRHHQARKAVRVVVSAMPRIEAIGDDVLWVTSRFLADRSLENMRNTRHLDW
ncbi:MAG: hypothetical protein ACI9KE_000289 [Polyangiales bacterium]|jgi:hypothetical protein